MIVAPDVLRQAEGQLLLEDAALIPLWNRRESVLVKPNVQGWFIDAQGLPRLAEVSVSPKS